MIFPLATNEAYTGSMLSVWYLGLMTLLTIVPGWVHMFREDGGAISIAGLSVGDRKGLVFSLFAWAGATQFVWGLMMALVVLRYQSFVPVMLLLLLIERALHTWFMWFSPKSEGIVGDKPKHHPPEAKVTLVVTALNGFFLFLSL